jgi:hypothetical protein
MSAILGLVSHLAGLGLSVPAETRAAFLFAAEYMLARLRASL